VPLATVRSAAGALPCRPGPGPDGRSAVARAVLAAVGLPVVMSRPCAVRAGERCSVAWSGGLAWAATRRARLAAVERKTGLASGPVAAR